MSDADWWAEFFPALTWLRDALSRGSKRSRLRLTMAVCPAGHSLVEVYRGSDGLLYVIAVHDVPAGRYAPGTNGAIEAARYPNGRLPHRRAIPAVMPHDAVGSWCRCKRPQSARLKSATGWFVPAAALVSAAATGTRRIVADASWQVGGAGHTEGAKRAGSAEPVD